jgi:hypothetical protein
VFINLNHPSERIHGVMVGSNPKRVKPKTIKLVFVASQLSRLDLCCTATTTDDRLCVLASLTKWSPILHMTIWMRRPIKSNLIIVSLKINLFSPWYSWKIAELALNNNHSLLWIMASDYPCKYLQTFVWYWFISKHTMRWWWGPFFIRPTLLVGFL